MADNATITVNDGQSTPVAHDFDPVRIDGDVASYQNKVATSFEGRETLKLKHTTSPRVRTTKVDMRIPFEVEETINGVTVPKVVNFSTSKAEVIIPLSWTAAQAKNARVMLANALLSDTIGLAVDDGELVW